MFKVAGGGLYPANDIESEKMKRFKNNELYTVDLKTTRNPGFHKKVFLFFNFCFEHWLSDKEYMSTSEQFDVFRNHMTVIAGYYSEYYNIDGSVRIEAKSLSYAKMEQSEYEEVYSALINVALKKIFKTTDENTYNQLVSFF